MFRKTIAFLSLLCTATAVFAAGPSTGLTGRWRLTEQYYNGGRHNFAADAPALRLAFRHDAAGFTGAVLYDAWQAAWPAWPTPEGPAFLGPGTVVRVAPDGQQVEATYQVLPAVSDDTALRVRETCTLETADRLRCDVAVTFERAGQSSGGFTWRRVFTREDAP